VIYGLRNASWDLSPWKGNGSSGNTLWLELYSGLMANPGFGTALEDMHYDMAESVEFSADRLTATIKLRDYIHDSKGNPIKAEDVVFSYQTAPEVSGVFSRVDTLMDSINAVDELTIEMKIKRYDPGTWESLLSYCPVVSKEWYEGASDDEKANNPATTGAYYVVENVVGTGATFAKVEDFWQEDALRSCYQIANVKTIEYVCITEDAMRSIALEKGEIDIAYLETESAPRFMDDPDYNVYETVMTNPTSFLLSDAESSPFHNNPALRKAILHAIDFEQVLLAAGGAGFQCHDIAPRSCGDYIDEWDNAPNFDYDLDVAKQYLAEAGYTENSNLELHFLCRKVGAQEAVVVVVKSLLEKIGINLIVDAYDQALYDTYLAEPDQWDIVWLGASNVTGFVTESWDWYFGSRGEQGTVAFVKDDKLQELLDAAKDKHDEASLNAFRDYYMEQGYGVNAFTSAAYQCSRADVTNIYWNFLMNLHISSSTFSENYPG